MGVGVGVTMDTVAALALALALVPAFASGVTMCAASESGCGSGGVQCSSWRRSCCWRCSCCIRREKLFLRAAFGADELLACGGAGEE